MLDGGVRLSGGVYVSGQMDSRRVTGDDRHGGSRKGWSKRFRHLMHQVRGDEAMAEGSG